MCHYVAMPDVRALVRLRAHGGAAEAPGSPGRAPLLPAPGGVSGRAHPALEEGNVTCGTAQYSTAVSSCRTTTRQTRAGIDSRVVECSG